jgi:hypothetical protein
MLVTIRHQDRKPRNHGDSGSPWTGVLRNPMAPALAAVCTKGAENLAAMQKEWLETLEHARRGWAAHFEAEATLGSDFATKAIYGGLLKSRQALFRCRRSS